MKKTSLAILALLMIGLAAAPAVAANHNDFKAIQKAVKQNPNYEEGREVRWFKVLITEGRSHEAKLKITLPIALVELVLSCSDNRHLKYHDDDCEIDLKALWTELKKAGPMALIEIQDDDAIIKVWLE